MACENQKDSDAKLVCRPRLNSMELPAGKITENPDVSPGSETPFHRDSAKRVGLKDKVPLLGRKALAARRSPLLFGRRFGWDSA